MHEHLWYKDAIVYGVDVRVFQDSDDDGTGDLPGLTRRLDHLVDLGVTCIWLLPVYPTPFRDNGYDIMDYYRVDPALGTLEQFEAFVRSAGARGIGVICDLVMNHTSDRHPWFEAARRDPDSAFRDYYVWSHAPPPVTPGRGTIFPGQESTVWTYDEVARAFYYHRFYDFEPELQIANPAVRDEVHRVMDYWLSFGISGFRLDAASHMIEPKGLPSNRPDSPHRVLKELRGFAERRRAGAVLLAEADVEPHELAYYFGEGDELNLLFNFLLDNYVMLALARGDARPIVQALDQLPALPEAGQWANFLRNLDELDLERLTDEEREDVFRAFAPDPDMRIYGRGIRRRLAPMLCGDRRRMELSFSLLFSLPGTPVIVYGDEIGMGDDLSLPGRNAVRTPMQWDEGANAGFSGADAGDLLRPVVAEGRFGYPSVNVAAQNADPGSFLSWMKRLVRVRRQCPGLGRGEHHVLPSGDDAVLMHRIEWRGEDTVFAHNLSAEERQVSLDLSGSRAAHLEAVLGDVRPRPEQEHLFGVDLPPYGYGWFRIVERTRTL